MERGLERRRKPPVGGVAVGNEGSVWHPCYRLFAIQTT
jgi:hypothetical protein